MMICISTSDDGLYLYKVSLKYSRRYGSYRADTMFIEKNPKGHNSVKLKMELPLFFSAHCLMMICISTKFHDNILGGIKVIEGTLFSSEKNSKGHDSVKNVGGGTVLVLCTSSDDGLYLYEVS